MFIYILVLSFVYLLISFIVCLFMCLYSSLFIYLFAENSPKSIEKQGANAMRGTTRSKKRTYGEGK